MGIISATLSWRVCTFYIVIRVQSRIPEGIARMLVDILFMPLYRTWFNWFALGGDHAALDGKRAGKLRTRYCNYSQYYRPMPKD